MQRVVSIFYYIMLAISAGLFLLYYVGPVVPGSVEKGLPEPVVTAFSLQYAYAILGITTLLALIFPIINGIRDPQNIGRSIVIAVGAIIIFGGCYYFSSGTILKIPGYSGTDNVPWVLKVVDTGLFVMYLSFIGALLSIVYAEVRRYFL
jgi:hypothetical protein